MNKKKQKVMVGMSGGVDSSVAAALLLEQGYEVIGAFMKNWSDENDCEDETGKGECAWRVERRDAMRVAAKLGIEFYTFDFEKEYREEVYDYMIREYQAGRTPNPDVLCNKYMKFGYLLREAEKLGCDFIATGHYAQTRIDEQGTHLLAGVDKNKDQSYFLCQLNQEQLKKIMFPIGDLKKTQVRDLARKFDLHVAEKKDSQGICFVGKVKLLDFLKARIPEQPGKIVSTSGKVLGEHKGYAYYTIGQRTGLKIGGGRPYFVVARRPPTNEIVVAFEDDAALFSTELDAVDLVETIPSNLIKFVGQKIKARIRYRQSLQSAVIEKIQDGKAHVKFDQSQRAVAPGQFIAFYSDDELIGSGVIQASTET